MCRPSQQLMLFEALPDGVLELAFTLCRLGPKVRTQHSHVVASEDVVCSAVLDVGGEPESSVALPCADAG